jgi:hypothetical protein
MPWKSAAQERWGNSPAGHKALGDAGVDEWNAASKGMNLPKRVKPMGAKRARLDSASAYKIRKGAK